MSEQKTVYIIETNMLLQERTAAILEQSNRLAVCGVAGDMEMAIQNMAHLLPDIIVLDIALIARQVDADIRQLKQLAPEALIICTSGRWSDAEKEIVLNAGADEYLTHPFSVADIAEIIKIRESKPAPTKGKVIPLFTSKNGYGNGLSEEDAVAEQPEETAFDTGSNNAVLQFGGKNMAEQEKVYIIETNKLLQERAAAIIAQIDHLVVCGTVGDMEAATQSVGHLLPDIILLDIAAIAQQAEMNIGQLKKLVPEAMIVCISGRRSDAEKELVLKAGADEYLTRPFSIADIAEITQIRQNKRMEKRQMESTGGTIITLFTPKGGYGKSSLAVNLAIGLREETGLDVGIIDANLQFGDIAVFCNVAPTVSIYEAARDIHRLTPQTLASYFTDYTDQIKLLACPLHPEQADLIAAEQFAAVLQMARNMFSYIIVDTPSGFGEISLTAAAQADMVYLLCALNTGCELEHMRRSMDYFLELGYPREKLHIIVNRVRQRNLETLRKMEHEIGHPVTTLLPNDFQLAVTASNAGQPMINVSPDSGLVRGIMDIVRGIAAC